MSDRLYSDPDFYVRVQKTKLAIVVAGIDFLARAGVEVRQLGG